jgi:hypothetical protein
LVPSESSYTEFNIISTTWCWLLFSFSVFTIALPCSA